VQQALKKQIISVFEPMYMDVLNDNMVGLTNIYARDMLNHLFGTFGNITAVDLEINFEHMRRAWDPQQPVESLFKQIQDCADYSDAGGRPYWAPTAKQCWICKYICTRALYEHLSSVERKTHLLTRLGHNLRPTSHPTTVSTSKCKVNQQQQPGTILPKQLLDKHKTKWLKLPLEH
jgi:hypothetical protein